MGLVDFILLQILVRTVTELGLIWVGNTGSSKCPGTSVGQKCGAGQLLGVGQRLLSSMDTMDTNGHKLSHEGSNVVLAFQAFLGIDNFLSTFINKVEVRVFLMECSHYP